MPTTTIPRSSRWRCSRSRRSASCGALDRTRYAARESAACVRLRDDLRGPPGARDRRGAARRGGRGGGGAGGVARGRGAGARARGPRLAERGLPAPGRPRRGAGVVTWKSTATVLRFLQLAGAGAALLELEARMVARDLRAALNPHANP